VIRARAPALALALAAAACGTDRREAERAVRGYDDALAVAYRTRDASRLDEVATAREVGKVRALVELKTQARLVLESELQALDLGDVRPEAPDALAARTRERWRYWDRPLDPGRPQGDEIVAEMELEYRLVRAPGGRWKVDEVRALSMHHVEPRGRGRETARGAATPGAQDSR
jgi:hypothetical protein